MDDNTADTENTAPRPSDLGAAAAPKAPKRAKPKLVVKVAAKRVAKPRAAARRSAATRAVAGSSQPTVADTLGKFHYDVPKIAKRRQTMDPMSMDAGDKVEGLAVKFHQEQDVNAVQEAAPAVAEREAAMHSTKTKGIVVPEEDRRRALLSKRIGVNLFKRAAGEERPDEPNLAEVNQSFFKQADAERQRKSDLQEKIGDTLVAAFGRTGKRIQKSLR